MNNNKRMVNWISSILDENSKLGEKGIKILHNCGAECSKTSPLLSGAKKIRNEFSDETNSDIIFSAFKKQYYDQPTFTKQGNKITLIFEECTCPLVKLGVNNPFLCNCTVGYTKNIFESLFGKPVEVKLLESVLSGDKVCRQEILI